MHDDVKRKRKNKKAKSKMVITIHNRTS